MADLLQTMQAIVLDRDGYSDEPTGPFIEDLKEWASLRDVPVPRPRAGEVLVKVALANVNPADLHYLKGEYGLPRKAGTAAGFEGVGTVVAAGEGEAAQALVGRRVALAGLGLWAEYARADAATVIPVADGIRDEDAAAFVINPLTAWAMVDLVAKAGAPSLVMTAGASQLGKLMASLARDRGLGVVAVVRREEHRSTLEGLGATTVLNTAREDFEMMLVQAMKQEGPRVLLDAVADQNSAEIFSAMPAGSRWVIYGKLSNEAPRLPSLGHLVFMKKSIEGFWLSEWMQNADEATRKRAVEDVMNRFGEGAWTTDVREIVAMADAPEKLATALEGVNRGKVLLRP